MLKWVVLILVLMFVYHVREVFPPFVVGGIIAYLLFPLVSILHRFLTRFWVFKWMTPGWAVAFIYLMTAAVIGTLVYKLGPTLAEQINTLVTNRQDIATKLVQSASDQLNLNLNVPESSQALLKWLEDSVANPSDIAHFGGLLSHSLLDILVCIVSSIYFMLDSKRVGRFFLRFVPDHKKTTMVNMIGQMNLMLSKYVVGQLILIALMSAVAFGFLTCWKIKYALLVAILSGCFEIIPVLGPFIAISIAVIVAVSQFGISIQVPGIIACYMIARWLEDYAVIPAIIGHAVELHPLAVIFAVLVGETMAGPLGMLIAIPVAASCKVVIDTFYPPEHDEPQAHPQSPNLMARLFSSLSEPTHRGNGTNAHSTRDDRETTTEARTAEPKAPEVIRTAEPKAPEVIRTAEPKAPEVNRTAEPKAPEVNRTAEPKAPEVNRTAEPKAPEAVEAREIKPPAQEVKAIETKPTTQIIQMPIDPASESAMPAKRSENNGNAEPRSVEPPRP